MTTPKPLIADRITAAVLLALCIAVLMWRVVGIEIVEMVARGIGLVLTIVVLPRFGMREWVLLAIASALAISLWSQGETDALGRALGNGAFFSAFILCMMLLREAAMTSDSVLRVGSWMTVQPPGRRFVATWIGGHLAGLLMNFGAVSLLAPLVQRGSRAQPIETDEDERRAQIRERRQLSSLLRGFAMVIAWAPTSLAQVIILSSVPGLDQGRQIMLGLCLGALMFFIGWMEDRLRWGPPRRPSEAASAFPKRAGMDLLIVYALLIIGAVSILPFVGGSLPLSLMAITPLMLVCWVAAQNVGHPAPLTNTAGRLNEIMLTAIPRMSKEAFLLGAAGFIGITGAVLAPIDLIANWLVAAQVPHWLLVASLPVIVTLCGQVALSPMIVVVFLAAIIASLPTLPARPEYIGIALAVGWSLSLTAAPNSTGAMLLGGATGLPTTTLTWRWNGVYSLIMMSVFTMLCWIVVE